MTTNQYSPLFKLAVKFLKYFLLAIFGFAIAYVISMSFGAFNIIAVLLPFAGDWFVRLGIILFCLMTTSIIFESLR